MPAPRGVAASPDHQGLLPAFRIESLPPDFYYIPNFITVEEENSMLQKIPAQRWVTLSHRRLQAHPSTLTKNNTLLAAPLPPYLAAPVVERLKQLGIFNDTPHKEPNHVLINEYRRGEGIMPHEDGEAYAEVVATVSMGASLCLEISNKTKVEENRETQPPPRQKDVGKDQQTLFEQGEEERESGNIINDATAPDTLSYKIPTRILQEPRSLLITTSSAYRDLLHGISPIEADEDLRAETVANWNLLGDCYAFEKEGYRNERATRVSLTYRDVLKVSSAANKVLGGLGKR